MELGVDGARTPPMYVSKNPPIFLVITTMRDIAQFSEFGNFLSPNQRKVKNVDGNNEQWKIGES